MSGHEDFLPHRPVAIPFGRFAPFVVIGHQVNSGALLATLIALAVEKSKFRN